MAAVQELSNCNADTEEGIEVEYPRPIFATLSEKISRVLRLSGGSLDVLPHSKSMHTESGDDAKLREEASTPGPDRYICVCFPGITYKKYLHHVDVNKAADDPRLFLALQRKYYDWKPWWRRLLTLRSLSRVEYFEVNGKSRLPSELDTIELCCTCNGLHHLLTTESCRC